MLPMLLRFSVDLLRKVRVDGRLRVPEVAERADISKGCFVVSRPVVLPLFQLDCAMMSRTLEATREMMAPIPRLDRHARLPGVPDSLRRLRRCRRHA